MPSGPGSFWDALRTWADSAGLLLPSDDGPRRPVVPQEVCDSCPICQAAATLDQVNPRVIEEMAVVARNVLAGLGSAMASAADQRSSGPVGAGEAPRSAQAPEGAAPAMQDAQPDLGSGDAGPGDVGSGDAGPGNR